MRAGDITESGNALSELEKLGDNRWIIENGEHYIGRLKNLPHSEQAIAMTKLLVIICHIELHKEELPDIVKVFPHDTQTGQQVRTFARKLNSLDFRDIE